MSSRAMIVVAGGSSTRFGGDKLMAEVAGKPLITHTIETVAETVDVCVVACRHELVDEMARLHPGVVVTPGGDTRTASELAGLRALETESDLIGIHDAARPAVSLELVHRLFEMAEAHGGAVPVLAPDGPLLDRRSGRPLEELRFAQTPQVFRGPDLRDAYARAIDARFVGHDTVEVMHRFGHLEIVAVPGDAGNVKVTYPADLERVRRALSDPSGI
ncbi:MAG TPA: 2-C-methyl-D-erythritol 4-phosphate cytidylyltransferase [Acidimicrobiia bacterium]|jgi:2-C-methyl-D-erythritol 4-phosphate cytidylyltransferase|nr:2-C-methyl-D-erythritol 4-phosphate cytidylyltransferase [Acidimicrobiia bacterium]